jgi:cytochrome c biogenesis protein CcdA/glutaredoxin
MKKRLFLISLILLTLITPLISTADSNENKVTIYVFHSTGCSYCAKLLTFLDEIKENYNLEIKEYEIHTSQENRDLFQKMAEAYSGEIDRIPTLFINNKMIVGFSNSKADLIKQEIQRCSKEKCISPMEKILEDQNSLKKTLTLPALITAAAVDAINPCAFAVLIILLTTILVSGIKKRALLAGLAFTLAIFISYFLMGLGLYSAIQASGLTHSFYIIVAILAILIGLFNLKDYLWYGRWFIMEVPMKWRPIMKKIIKSVISIPGAFLIGFIVSLFLLPCTSGPYIVILGLLAKTTTRNYAILLLLLYNFIFILPMLIITLAVYLGFTTTEKAEQWRTQKLKILHLIAGVIILLLGIGMLIALSLGIV